MSKWMRFTAVALIAAAAMLALVAAEPAGSAAKKSASSSGASDKIKRGEYLTTVMSCGDCHTPGTLFGVPDFARKFSGSELGWRGPWGVTYAANLTPDPETGIGKWSTADIVKTLRTGQRPDGRVLMPPMPYPNLAHLSDADAEAIAAYLKSLPPIVHKNLGPVPPGQAATGSIIDFPPPATWDAPHTPAEQPAGKP
jgi:mono/diheme cytochrome c family protein